MASKWHQIRGNETIGSIAGMWGTTPYQLLDANPGIGNELAQGAYLRVPSYGMNMAPPPPVSNISNAVSPFKAPTAGYPGVPGYTQPKATTGITPVGVSLPPPMPQGTYNARYREFIPSTPKAPVGVGSALAGDRADRATYIEAILNMIDRGQMPEISPQFLAAISPDRLAAFMQDMANNGYVKDARGYYVPTGTGTSPALAALTEQEKAAGVVGRDEKTGEKIYKIGDYNVAESDIGGAGRRGGESYFNPKTGNWRTNGGSSRGQERRAAREAENKKGGNNKNNGATTMNVSWRIG